MRNRNGPVATPIEFEVGNSVYDQGDQTFVVKGVVAPGTRFGPDMVMTVPWLGNITVSFPVQRIRVVRRSPAGDAILVWVKDEEPDDADLLFDLLPRDEMALIWNAGDEIDRERHFVHGRQTREFNMAFKRTRENPFQSPEE